MEYIFRWTPKISVFNEKIDHQHQQLLGQVNSLLLSIVDMKSDVVVGEAVSFLDKYINEHLAYEEKYMKEHNYPDIKEHIRMHRDFINHYDLFKTKLQSGVSRESLALEVEQYIGKWWIEHIGKADKKYALFISGIPIEEENKKI